MASPVTRQFYRIAAGVIWISVGAIVTCVFLLSLGLLFWVLSGNASDAPKSDPEPGEMLRIGGTIFVMGVIGSYLVYLGVRALNDSASAWYMNGIGSLGLAVLFAFAGTYSRISGSFLYYAIWASAATLFVAAICSLKARETS